MDTKLEVGMKVELLPGREDVYPRAVAAMRGVVRGLKKDRHGYPQAYIDWDKEHWRYNNEEDGWTFAAHFRPVEGEEKELVGAEVHEIPTVIPTGEEFIPTEAEEDMIEEYLNVLMMAADKAAESDAFYFISLKRDPNNQIKLEITHAANDEELANLPSADVFRFAEQEMRRRGS